MQEKTCIHREYWSHHLETERIRSNHANGIPAKCLRFLSTKCKHSQRLCQLELLWSASRMRVLAWNIGVDLLKWKSGRGVRVGSYLIPGQIRNVSKMWKFWWLEWLIIVVPAVTCLKMCLSALKNDPPSCAVFVYESLPSPRKQQKRKSLIHLRCSSIAADLSGTSVLHLNTLEKVHCHQKIPATRSQVYRPTEKNW